MEVTEAVHEYVVKRITNLGKFLSGVENKGGEVAVYFDVLKTTNHHKGGDIFRADCSIMIDGEKFYASADKSDLYEAIDAVKESIFHEISKTKAKRKTLFHRGARKIKNLVKGAQFWK